MFYFHADDYGINLEQSKRIIDCRRNGCLNSVSIVPNSPCLKEAVALLDDECKKSIHLNFCEGKSLSDSKEIPLLANNSGWLHRSFLRVLLCSFFMPKKLEEQAEKECTAQINNILKYLPDDYKLRLDSHQHYHMIPAVFKGLCRAAAKTGREVEYIRIPYEHFSYYLSEQKLRRALTPLSIVKALVCNILGAYNVRYMKRVGWQDKRADYIGVLLTDKMYSEYITCLIRVMKRLGKDYKTSDIEIQFHPGRIDAGEEFIDNTICEWYMKKNRDLEAEALKVLRKSEWQL